MDTKIDINRLPDGMSNYRQMPGYLDYWEVPYTLYSEDLSNSEKVLQSFGL